MNEGADERFSGPDGTRSSVTAGGDDRGELDGKALSPKREGCGVDAKRKCCVNTVSFVWSHKSAKPPQSIYLLGRGEKL